MPLMDSPLQPVHTELHLNLAGKVLNYERPLRPDGLDQVAYWCGKVARKGICYEAPMLGASKNSLQIEARQIQNHFCVRQMTTSNEKVKPEINHAKTTSYHGNVQISHKNPDY